MSQTGWYIAQNGQQIGPMDYGQLVAHARARKLLPTDLVWKEGMLEWQTADRVGGLFEAAGTTPPPIPSAAPRIAPPPPPVPAGAPLGYATPQVHRTADIGQDAGMRLLLPVGRSGWAIASGYLGLFSVLLIFAPFALLTGILAVRDIKRHPDRHGMGRAVFGIIMGAIFTLVLAFALFGLIVSGQRGR